MTLRFFRPVAFGLMKLTYVAAAWQPTWLHAASLGWHLLACLLLLALLRRLGSTPFQAWVIVALFAVHPAHLATVQWIACQTELMVTVFLLGATLCFAHFRCWPGFGRTTADGQHARPWPWAAGAVTLFALALGCRENAVMLPLVLLAVEPVLRRSAPTTVSLQPAARRAAVIGLFLALGAVTAGYAVLRVCVLGGYAVPPRPYVFPPSDPGFWRFVFDKALYYLLGNYFAVPCVPIAGLPVCREHPLLFYAAAGAALVLVAGCFWRFRTEPAGWLAPAWLFGFMVPLLPVFASPHHLYLPGIGWALNAALLLRLAAGAHADHPSSSTPAGPIRSSRLRAGVTWTCVALVGALFLTWTYYSSLVLETGVRVEACLADDIAASAPALQDGDSVYVANIPVVAHYLRLALEERTGRRNLRIVPLMWAPRLLGPATATELTQVDAHTFDVHIAGDRYFAGPLGTLIREATGDEIPDSVDRSVDLGVAVQVLARDTGGISGLRFRFKRALSDPQLHLFWSSRASWASELRFSKLD